jgi:hypothetical protein
LGRPRTRSQRPALAALALASALGAASALAGAASCGGSATSSGLGGGPPVTTGTDAGDAGITHGDGGDGGGDAGLADAGDAGITDGGDAGITDGGDAGVGDGGCAGALARPVSVAIDRCSGEAVQRTATLIDQACVANLYLDNIPVCQGRLSGDGNAFQGTCHSSLTCSSQSLPGRIVCANGTDAGCAIEVCGNQPDAGCQPDGG